MESVIVSGSKLAVPEIFLDYMYLEGKWPFNRRADEDGELGMPIIILKDRETRFRRAMMLPAKGVNSYAVKAVAREIIRTYGYHTLCLRSDQEPAIVALKEAVKRGVNIQMSESPVDEHQANGVIENAVREVA